MRILIALVIILGQAVGPVFAGKPVREIPVTHIISDYDDNNTPYSIQSDGYGPYINGVNKDASILTGANYADRILQNGVIGDFIRTVAITFSQENAVRPGDPGYVADPNPPVWGTIYDGVRFMNKCSETNTGFLPMQAGEKKICQMHIRMWPLGTNNDYYRLDMGTPGEDETQRVQITCNAHDSVGCTDWFIDPIPVINEDGSDSPGKTRARLNYIYFIRNRGYMENRGAFYMTFHIHVTRP
jgi:hypothetical protein